MPAPLVYYRPAALDVRVGEITFSKENVMLPINHSGKGNGEPDARADGVTAVTGNKRVNELISKMTLVQKLQIVQGGWNYGWDDLREGKAGYDMRYNENCAGFIKGIPELRIPDVYITDGEYGINTIKDATLLPSKVGLAATFDTDAAFLHGVVLGKEVRALGTHVVLSPRVNIARAPVTEPRDSNGGNFQTFGEDPYLNGILGAAEATGIQKDNNAIATLKQMLGSSTGAAQGAEFVVMDQQTMHEIYMPAFQEVVRAGVGAAMTNYNRVNGTWTAEFGEMNNKMMRERWGFQGFIMDDWFCLDSTNAMRNGLDLEMPGAQVFGEVLKNEILQGQFSEALLDISVGRILCQLDRFGMLDVPRDIHKGEISESLKLESAAAALELGEKVAVLLKNTDVVLPLNPADTFAVVGPTGRSLAGPIFKEGSFGFIDRKVSPVYALEKTLGKEIPYAVGNDSHGVPVPSSALVTEDGKSVGLNRYKQNEKNEMVFETIDKEIDMIGSNALPRANYEWRGSIDVPEDGYYRIMMHSEYPSAKVAQENAPDPNLRLGVNGDVWIDEEQVCYAVRISLNGGPSPYASMVTSNEGLNNASGYVHLKKGKHQFRMAAHSISSQPVGVRLNWVTPSMHNQSIKDAVTLAKTVDKVVVFAWHNSPNVSLNLAEGQDELIAAVAAVNPNTIVVLNTGDPVAMPWKDKVKGILEMWYPGQEGGWATANILLGKANPGGKLPVTFPTALDKTPVYDPSHPERRGPAGRPGPNGPIGPKGVAEFTEGVNVGYRWYDENNVTPLFEFGFGLSYTTFEYSDLVVRVEADKSLTVRFNLKNTGRVAGSEVPQVYIGRPKHVPNGVQMSPKLLAAFSRISLASGKTQTVTLKVDQQRLSYWNTKASDWAIAYGDRPVLVGSSSRDIRLTGNATLTH
jgi:beta-glucosidase